MCRSKDLAPFRRIELRPVYRLLYNGMMSTELAKKKRIWLTDAQKLEAITRYGDGTKEPVEDIAKSFGVCMNNIYSTLHSHGVKVRDKIAARTKIPHRGDAFTVLTPESSYWSGFFAADGWTNWTKKGKGSPIIQLALQARDRDHLVKFRDFLGSGHAISKFREGKKSVIEGRQLEEHPTFIFSLRSAQIAADFSLRGIGVKSLQRVVTDDLAYNRDFWRGMIDGDGYVGDPVVARRIGFCGGLGLVNQFIAFARSHGIGMNTNARPEKSIYVTGFTKDQAARLIRILYSDATVFLDRKNERAQATIQGVR